MKREKIIVRSGKTKTIYITSKKPFWMATNYYDGWRIGDICSRIGMNDASDHIYHTSLESCARTKWSISKGPYKYNVENVQKFSFNGKRYGTPLKMSDYFDDYYSDDFTSDDGFDF